MLNCTLTHIFIFFNFEFSNETKFVITKKTKYYLDQVIKTELILVQIIAWE